MDLGLLVARLVGGALIAAHGTQKLFGWFGGYGLAATGTFFESLGFHPGRIFAAAAAVAEVSGGLLVALGLFGPIGPAAVVAVMIVAAVSVHWQHGIFAMTNGIELPLLYAAGGAALALTGPGLYSLDAMLGLAPVWTSALTWSILGLGIVGGVASLLIRHTAPATPAGA